jgi:nucleoid-associated protein YgaU
MSLRFADAQLDYAFLLPLSGLSDTGGSHRISLTYRFGRADEKAPAALLEQEEILGEYPDSNVDAMREELHKVRAETEAYQKETDAMSTRIAELESQLAVLKAAPVPAPVAAPVPAPVPAPIPVAPPVVAPVPAATPAPAPAVDVEQQQRMERMQDELSWLQQELKRRQKAPAAAPSEKFKRPGTYTVQDGDTLQGIAKKTMGSQDRWVEIYQANKDRLKRGGAVTTGQLLVIP